jgi:hypothetical protein
MRPFIFIVHTFYISVKSITALPPPPPPPWLLGAFTTSSACCLLSRISASVQASHPSSSGYNSQTKTKQEFAGGALHILSSVGSTDEELSSRINIFRLQDLHNISVPVFEAAEQNKTYLVQAVHPGLDIVRLDETHHCLFNLVDRPPERLTHPLQPDRGEWLQI